jgi:hypothetical protein
MKSPTHESMAFLTVTAVLFMTLGCQPADDRFEAHSTESNLTAGMAKVTIKKGVTPQSEIIETFGPPDLVTHRDGMQIWTYDKLSYDQETTGGTVSLFRSGTRSRSSSTSTMMILYFDSSDIVQDYRMSVVRF